MKRNLLFTTIALALSTAFVFSTFTAFAADDASEELTADAPDFTAEMNQKMEEAGAPTLTDQLIDQINANSSSNTIRVVYKPSIVISKEVMQAIKDSGSKVLVLTQLRNKDPLWKIVIAYNQISDPARSFKPSFKYEQDRKSAALSLTIGTEGKKFGCNAKICLPADSGLLEKDVKLEAGKMTLYKQDAETKKYVKTDKELKIDDKGFVYFTINEGGLYRIANDPAKRFRSAAAEEEAISDFSDGDTF